MLQLMFSQVRNSRRSESEHGNGPTLEGGLNGPPTPAPAIPHRAPATGPATGHRTGHRPPATGHRPPATGPATGHGPPARPPATGRATGTGHRHRPPAPATGPATGHRQKKYILSPSGASGASWASFWGDTQAQWAPVDLGKQWEEVSY